MMEAEQRTVPLLCEICRKQLAAGVASLQLGRCQACIQNGAEPLWLVEAILDQIGSLKHGAPWLQQIRTFSNGQYISVADVERIRQYQQLSELTLCPPQKTQLFHVPQRKCCAELTHYHKK